MNERPCTPRRQHLQSCGFSWAKCVLLVAVLNFAVFVQRSSAQQLMSGGPLGSSDDISEMSLEELMDVDVRTGQSGGFGTQLEQLDVEAYLHAYAVVFYRDNDLNRGSSVNTFDLHYFNVIVGADISDKIASEVLLEYEHRGDETEVRYGICTCAVRKAPATLSEIA